MLHVMENPDPTKNLIWRMHEQTNYPLQIIKGAGHNANVDKPEEMNFIINEFLEEKVLCS